MSAADDEAQPTGTASSLMPNVPVSAERSLVGRDVVGANKALVGCTVGYFVGFAATSLFGSTSAVFAVRCTAVAVAAAPSSIRVAQKALLLTPAQLGLLTACPNLSAAVLRVGLGAIAGARGACARGGGVRAAMCRSVAPGRHCGDALVWWQAAVFRSCLCSA